MLQLTGEKQVKFDRTDRVSSTASAGFGRLRDEGGWTLMETMVVSTLIAILSAIAIPQYNAVALQMRTSSAATEILGDIQYARTMSQRTGVPHYIDVTGGGPVNYRVRRQLNPGTFQAGDPTVRTVTLGPKLAHVAFRQNGVNVDCFGTDAGSATPASPLAFNTRGLPSAASSYFVGSDDGDNTYVVSVTGAGRARVCRRVGGAWK